MTCGWFIFGIVLPALAAGGGWIMVLAQERYLRAQEVEPAEAAR